MRSSRVLMITAVVLGAVTVGSWLISRNFSSSSGIAQTARAGDLSVTLRLDDATVGLRTIDITVEDASGRPADIGEVRLSFAMTDMDMGVSEVGAQQVGKGRFRASGSYFTMVGNWQVAARLLRDGQPVAQVPFQLAIAARGEVGGPINPIGAQPQALATGQQLYAANCISCHGATGRGDGPAAAGLNPRPADFAQHMVPGQHTDGQIFQWISDGFPNSAMPAWKDRLSEEEIWQLVVYLRSFGRPAPTPTGMPQVAGATPGATSPDQPLAPTGVPTTQEPLPPLVFARAGNLWRSDGNGAPPRQLTNFTTGSYVQYPSFSPAGDQLTFILVAPPPPTATLPLPSSTLYVMDADGGNQRAIWKPANGMLGIPAWSNDARSLYVATNGVDALAADGRLVQIARVDLASGAPTPLLPDALDPALSRDGAQLAYLKLDEDGYTMSLMVAAPDGSNPRELLAGDEWQGFYAPRFSPDGKRIVVAAVAGPETDAEGNPKAANAPSAVDRLLGLFEPATAEAHGIPWELWSINADGSGLRRLTNFAEDLPMAAFAPDGGQIAVLGELGMYLMDPDGSQLRRIDSLGDRGGLDWAR
jgi:mono/diheme cytochrome c family protein